MWSRAEHEATLEACLGLDSLGNLSEGTGREGTEDHLGRGHSQDIWLEEDQTEGRKEVHDRDAG